MMKVVGLRLTGAALSACGADGEPVQPIMNSTVFITGGGVSGSTDVSLRKRPFTLGLSLWGYRSEIDLNRQALLGMCAWVEHPRECV